MKITLLQTDIAWSDPVENTARADRLLAKAPGADLYVLPEMWSTGFTTQEKDIMADDHSLAWMMKKSEEMDAAICGSIVVKASESSEDSKKFFNRMYFVKPDGTYNYYDKRHLFTYGRENEHFESGSQRVVAEYKGVRFLLQICYDLRFPVWSRYKNDYDAIIYVANWPKARRKAWDILLQARALENQCYVIATNRVGTAGNVKYNGGSVIIDAWGHSVVSCLSEIEEFATADIDLEYQNKFRHDFPVLEDRDK